MKQKSLFLAVASSLVIAMGSAWGAGTQLPYGDDFESGTSGDDLPDPWSHTDVGVYNSSQARVDGSAQSAYFSDEGSFLVDTNNYGPYSNVWWKCYAKITAGSSDPTLDADTVAGFYINGDGELRALSGEGWIEVANGLTTSDWIGLAVHLDYVAEKWDIYKTPEGYEFGDEAELLNTGAALDFNDAAGHGDEFTQATIQGTTYIDRFAVNSDSETVDDDSPAKAADAAVNIILGENLTGVLTKYFSSNDSTLGGPLGEALASALLSGDIVYVYDAGVWTTYTVQGPGQPFSPSGAGVTISPTTAVFVDFVNGGTRSPARVTAYDTLQPAGTAVPINGTDNGGWTALCVPFGSGSTTVGGLGLTNASEGDQLWIKKLTDGFEMPLRYDATDARWEKGRTDATAKVLSEGQAFWYRRNTDVATTWNASGLTVE